MSLDEYQLRFNSHLRRAREHRGDIPRFVAGRNDHRHAQRAIVTALTPERARDHDIRQCQMANRPQAYEDAVRKRAENGNRQRTQDFLPRPDHTEVGQPEQVVDIGNGQPVLLEQWRASFSRAAILSGISHSRLKKLMTTRVPG